MPSASSTALISRRNPPNRVLVLPAHFNKSTGNCDFSAPVTERHAGLITVREIRSVDAEQLQGDLHQGVVHQKPRPESVQHGHQVGC